MRTQRKKLGDILVDAGKITLDDLKEALSLQRTTNKKIGELLVEKNIISEEDIVDTLSMQLFIEKVDLEKTYVNSDVARTIPKNVAEKYSLIPFQEQSGRLLVALADPLNVYAIDDLQFITKKIIVPRIASKSQVDNAIDLYYTKQSSDKAIEELEKEYSVEIKDSEIEEILDDVQNAPSVRLVNSILTQAINMKASDIHIEPFESDVKVRFRIDGVLNEVMKVPKKTYSAVSTRLKIMASMDIAEKRKPLDGRIEMTINGANYDFRVSSLPTFYAEKIVIRILDRTNFLFDREMLGFSRNENKLIDQFEKAPYGIVLVTGPTGSGKSTTLYTMLREINQPEINIITVEDPVEYMLYGINQVQVNNKAGLSFAAGLRSILRQDPDVVMLGEIRDEETAQIAVRAAITGHLVLSTLHTNDAPSTITRLIDMGLEPYLVADAVIGIVAQRLVRKLCKDCKEEYITTEFERKALKIDKDIRIYKPKGCPQCNGSGYKGRIAIHEVLKITNELKFAIEKEENSEVLRKIAVRDGMVDLYGSCRELVLRGTTSIQEMVKTVYAEY